MENIKSNLHIFKLDNGLQLDGMPLKGVKSYSVSQKENGNRATLALVMDVRILGNQKPLTKFEVLKMITDEQKFSEMIFDMLHEYDTSDKLAEFLSEEMPDNGLQTVQSIAQSDYPLSFERRQ